MNSRTLAHLSGLICALSLHRGYEQAEAVEFPDDHPALSLFPSPEDWRQRVDAARRDRPSEFAAAQTDFDLAIRSAVLFDGDRPSMESGSRIKVTLLQRCAVFTRRELERLLRFFEGNPRGEEFIAWYRAHFEDFVVEDTPALRLVLADVLLNGWKDWSAWEGRDREPLDALRAECREPHRHFAWKLIESERMAEFNGLTLRWLARPGDEHVTNLLEMTSVLFGHQELPVTDFLLQAATRDHSTPVRITLLQTAGNIGIPDDQYHAYLDLWASYLSSSNRVIRAAAVQATGTAVSGLRIYSKGRENSDALQARLQQIADADTDAEVRTLARHALESVRTAKWDEEP